MTGDAVYRSTDLDKWEKQGLILDGPSKREEINQWSTWRCSCHWRNSICILFHPSRQVQQFNMKPNPDGQWLYSNHRTTIQVAPWNLSMALYNPTARSRLIFSYQIKIHFSWLVCFELCSKKDIRESHCKRLHNFLNLFLVSMLDMHIICRGHVKLLMEISGKITL